MTDSISYRIRPSSQLAGQQQTSYIHNVSLTCFTGHHDFSSLGALIASDILHRNARGWGRHVVTSSGRVMTSSFVDDVIRLRRALRHNTVKLHADFVLK